MAALNATSISLVAFGCTFNTDLERFAQSRALQPLASVAQTRRLLVEQSRGSLVVGSPLGGGRNLFDSRNEPAIWGMDASL
jgi:hypothetical protein